MTFRALALHQSEWLSCAKWQKMDDSVIASLQLTIRSDEGQTLETLAKETLYGGKFILSTQLRKPIILSYYPNDTATQFL